MLDILLTLTLTVHAVDLSTVEKFIESRRREDNGPGLITLTREVDMNSDGTDDLFVAYTYGHGERPGDRTWGQYVVAFVSTPSYTFQATRIIFVPESELIFYTDFAVEAAGANIRITGLKRLSEDAMCCPTARSSFVFGLIDNELASIEGQWWKDPDLLP